MFANNHSSFVTLQFAHPAYLTLLSVLPLVVVLAFRSLSGIGAVRLPLAVAARCVVLGLLILALAGLEWRRKTDDQTAIFVVDKSASIPQDLRTQPLEFAAKAAGEMRPGKDRVAIVSFDGSIAVDQLPAADVRCEALSESSKALQTNIAGAVRMAMALFPPDAARRIVLISDGNETTGSVLADASTFATADIPIDVLPLRYNHRNEFMIERLTAPATAALNEPLSLNLIVRSQTTTAARLTIYHNDEAAQLEGGASTTGTIVALEPGMNRFTIPILPQQAGVQRFRAVLQPLNAGDDTLPGNNEGRAFSIVGAANRVLIVHESDSEADGQEASSARVLRDALQKSGMECELVSIENAALDPMSLADCSLVVLSNVSAFAMTDAQQKSLAAYVRELGGGLIAVGGDHAFSVGGYQGTPLENVLPVENDRAKLKFLSLSMVLIIDRSGSMEGEKIGMARSAASGAVRLLSRYDQIGVIGFSDHPGWIHRVSPCVDKLDIMRQIAEIGAGGGTDLYPAIDVAYGALQKVETNLKHVIILTDGQSAPGDFDAIAMRCARAGITISTIAIGQDADFDLLRKMAARCGGRSYVTNSAKPLPQIFAKETILAARSGLVERSFKPALRNAGADPIVAGLAGGTIPSLDGAVVTALKPLAQAPLVRVHDEGTDPILAYWQVGLGRSVAFMSGMWPRWGTNWVAWPGFTKFWEQCARYAARKGTDAAFNVIASTDGESISVVMEGRDLSANDVATMSMAGQTLKPDYSTQPLQVRQTGARRFEAKIAAPDTGLYIANITYRCGSGAQTRTGHVQTGVAVSRSAEFASVSQNDLLLSQLAQSTGGRMLYPDHPEAVFEPWSIRPIESRFPIWEDLVRFALIAFLLDVAIRRLAISPRGVYERLRRMLRLAAGAPAPADAVATTAALKDALHRAQPPKSESSRPARQTHTHTPDFMKSPPTGDHDDFMAMNNDKPVVAPPVAKARKNDDGEAGYASRLKRAKRDALRPLDDKDE